MNKVKLENKAAPAPSETKATTPPAPKPKSGKGGKKAC